MENLLSLNIKKDNISKIFFFIQALFTVCFPKDNEMKINLDHKVIDNFVDQVNHQLINQQK